MFAFLKGKDLVETGMIILWMIWNNRNNCIHQLTCRRALSIKIIIETVVKDFISVNCVHPPEEQQVWSEWNPPTGDGIKINVDAAFNSTTKIAILGLVARNRQAEICLSRITNLQDVETAL